LEQEKRILMVEKQEFKDRAEFCEKEVVRTREENRRLLDANGRLSDEISKLRRQIFTDAETGVGKD